MSSTLVRTGNELPNCHLITIVIMSIVGRYLDKRGRNRLTSTEQAISRAPTKRG